MVDELRQRLISALRQIYDPEISTNIYDLGLIYRIELEKLPHVDIDMTLTSAWCPSAEELPAQVKQAALALDGIATCDVKVVWTPQWGPHMMSEEARLDLNMFEDWPPTGDNWGRPW